MGTPVLILGPSGSGKSTSLRNFPDAAIVNVLGKPLPFKRHEGFKSVTTDDMKRIADIITEAKTKSVVIDDSGYCLTNYYKRNAFARNFDVYTDLALGFSNMVEAAMGRGDDCITYFMMHVEETQSGAIQPLTVGKFLNEKLNLCGMFTVCLISAYDSGRYVFRTQTAGNDPAKSPMGMFGAGQIDNDLKTVDDAIRDYYDMGGKGEKA